MFGLIVLLVGIIVSCTIQTIDSLMSRFSFFMICSILIVSISLALLQQLSGFVLFEVGKGVVAAASEPAKTL
jgi:uncharacterized protein (DUF983 family)